MVRGLSILCLVSGVLAAGAMARGQVAPYDPYADSQGVPAPIAADGTIQWGVFYKSASIQAAYQRLWNLGACRGTRKAITEPVNRNKLIIDRLPEDEHEGTVLAAAGGTAGGLIAFIPPGAEAHAEPLVVQLHPAGVTRLRVTGRAPAAVLRPGQVVRLIAEVNARGEARAPLAAFDIVTPPANFEPDAVEPNRRGLIVGTVQRVHQGTLTLMVPTGRLRRLTFTLQDDALATIDAAQLDLVAAGDAISITGRLWDGEGAMGAGTIFASGVTVAKPRLPGESPAAGDVATRP